MSELAKDPSPNEPEPPYPGPVGPGPGSLAGNAPLRLPMLTAAQVRAAIGCPICGAVPGQPCTRRLNTPRAALPANHHARGQLARALPRHGPLLLLA